MKPLEFLAEVLPSPGHGYYCVAELNTKQKKHVFVETLQEIKPTVRGWLQKARDIYFALATFEDPQDGRKAANARFVKALFIDMDGYETKKEAAHALLEFLERTGLDEFGAPYLVSSGGGVHAYWPLTEEAPIELWKPIAESFKRLCKQEGLVIDMTVTADAARVLRIPGTYNHKAKYGEPRPVELRQVGDAKVDLRRFGAVVRSLLTDNIPGGNNFEPGGLDLGGARPTKAAGKKSALAESLMQNAATRFDTIWLKTERGQGCAQLDYYRKHAQDDGMEPLWRGFLSWTKVCEDGLEHAIKLSEMHPYPLERMQEKLDAIKGPYPCVKMDSENPGVCSGCQHWGRITNPLALGREIQVDNTPKQISVPVKAETEDRAPQVRDEDDEDDTPAQATRSFTRPLPPKGFDYGMHGGVYQTVEIKDSAGNVSKVQMPVLLYDLFVVDVLRMEERELHAHLMAIRPVGPENDDGEREKEYISIILPYKTAVSKDELLKCLASHGVLAANGAINDKSLFDYVRGAVNAAIHNGRKAVDVPIQFGWQKDRSFVYNNRVFHPNGTTTPVPMPGLENINRATMARGTIEGWRAFWELLARRQMHTMLAMCMDSFGSILMHFSEYEGFVWHIGSTESGTGKSLTLTAKAGVWGHPIRYRTGKGTSPVAMQQRAGLLNSLPLLIDEITSKSRNDVEWAPAFIFDIAEGQGKERMESGANKERVNNSTWALTCTMTSNVHMIDVLAGARRHSAQGEIMRMLEWTPNKPLGWTEDERMIVKEVRRNYGVAGERWVSYVVGNYDTCRATWNRIHAKLKAELGFTDEERYWHAACTSLVAACVLTGSRYANIIDVPVRGIVEALRELVERNRDGHKRTHRTSEDILNAYTRDHYGKFVVIRRTDMGEVKKDLGLDGATRTSTRNTVMGRIEQDARKGTVEYFIEEQLLRQHCAAMSFGYADFKRQIEDKARLETAAGKLFRVRFCKKDLLAETDGPSLRVNVMHLMVSKANVSDDGAISVA